MTTVLSRLCIRSDTAANFTSANTLLLVNEMARETDTGKIKYGDGSTAWISLAYWSPGGVSSFNTRTGAVTLTYADVTGALGYTPTTVSGAVAGVAAAATGLIKSNGTALSPATASDINAALSYTPANQAGDTVTGTWTFSGVTQTLGNSTASSTANVGIGATTTGNTKAVNVGTGGVTGSTTNITIGTVAGGASNLLFHGTAGYTQAAQTTKSAATTLTAAEIAVGIVSYTGAAANLTLPTGTAIDAGFALLVTNTAFDFAIINTGSGTATVAVNTGVTSLGAMTVTAGASGQFRLRKTGTATYVIYRLS